MKTQDEKRDDDLSFVFSQISQLLDTGFYGQIIINAQNGLVYDLKIVRHIRIATLREGKYKLDCDENLNTRPPLPTKAR